MNSYDGCFCSHPHFFSFQVPEGLDKALSKSLQADMEEERVGKDIHFHLLNIQRWVLLDDFPYKEAGQAGLALQAAAARMRCACFDNKTGRLVHLIKELHHADTAYRMAVYEFDAEDPLDSLDERYDHREQCRTALHKALAELSEILECSPPQAQETECIQQYAKERESQSLSECAYLISARNKDEIQFAQDKQTQILRPEGRALLDLRHSTIASNLKVEALHTGIQVTLADSRSKSSLSTSIPAVT